MPDRRTVLCALCDHLYVSHDEGCPHCGSLDVRDDVPSTVSASVAARAALRLLAALSPARARIVTEEAEAPPTPSESARPLAG